MWEIIMRNWELREFGVQVNWPFPIQQVLLPIQRVRTSIWGLLNPIRQVLPLMSHIRSYPPDCSHSHPASLFLVLNSTIIVEHKVKSSFLSLYAMIMSWHQVQHSPSTTSTHDCQSSLHSHDYNLTPECSFSFRRASIQDQPALLESSKVKILRPHPHGSALTNWWIQFQLLAALPLTAAKYSSNLASDSNGSVFGPFVL